MLLFTSRNAPTDAPPPETKAASEDEDDEPEHDDWADAEWSPEAENINAGLRKARGRLRRGWAEVVALDVREAGKLVDRFFPEDGKAAKAGAGEFGAALEALYRNLRPEMERKLERLYHDLAQDAITAAAQQAGVDVAPFQDAILDTVTAYTGYEVADYTASSLAQLRAIARENKPTPARARLRERLDAWNARRPDKMSRVASVHATNWYVHETYKKCGVTKMRWVAQGGKTCGFCASLDGKIVGINDLFVPKGGKVSGNGATMITRRKIKHPPIHQGCVCVIVPAADDRWDYVTDERTDALGRLVNSGDAVAADEKLTKYCLDMGGYAASKAKKFADVLGIYEKDWEYLKNQIVDGVKKIPSHSQKQYRIR